MTTASTPCPLCGNIRRVLLFGIPVLTIETDDDPDEPGDCVTEAQPVGFVRDDLPTFHLLGEDHQ